MNLSISFVHKIVKDVDVFPKTQHDILKCRKPKDI